jgi:hypothetical protein
LKLAEVAGVVPAGGAVDGAPGLAGGDRRAGEDREGRLDEDLVAAVRGRAEGPAAGRTHGGQLEALAAVHHAGAEDADLLEQEELARVLAEDLF